MGTHTGVDRTRACATSIDLASVWNCVLKGATHRSIDCMDRIDASTPRRLDASTNDDDDDDDASRAARMADDAARMRIRRELAETWDVDGVGDGDGARRVSALRAMAENMRAVLAHCASVDGDDGEDDGGDDERAQVRSLLMVAARDVVVRVVGVEGEGELARAARSAVNVEGVTVTTTTTSDGGGGGGGGGDTADVVLCVVDGQSPRVLEDVDEAVKRSRAASRSRVAVVVEAADAGRFTRESVAAASRVPVENVFVTHGLFPGSRADIRRVLAAPPKRSEVASASISARKATAPLPSPASAFALDDDDDDDEEEDAQEDNGDARMPLDEWAAYVRADAAKCRDTVLRAVMLMTREVVLRLAEKLALQYEPLRSTLYARIRGEKSRHRVQKVIQRVAPPSASDEDAADAVQRRRYSSSNVGAAPLGIDVDKFRSVALQGVEQGATVATQVGEKVGSFLNWMVSEETDAERRRREAQESAWRERRKQLWEQERAAREAAKSTPDDGRGQSPRAYAAKHSPTASFVTTTTALVDMLDSSLGGDDNDARVGHQSKIAAAEARIRALEAALRALDPHHALLDSRSKH